MPDPTTLEALSAQLHALFLQHAQQQGRPLVRPYVELMPAMQEPSRMVARFILKHADAACVAAMLADPLEGDHERITP